ncbi:MAG: bifunctional folylpolyglutamate synthase/dihydrofolate synthase [Sulfurovum sp.]|nr:bifunctional folylpolyglutamate synthase/dihydrofolate synthase [Sulfurovum sp.]
MGTNGKGSTGRILAHLAYKSGLNVGHYTSPHILKFNERIWLDGKNISDEVLETAHQRLFRLLGQEMRDALSYFEYTTLLAFVVFQNCDLMVLEAGLGGEFDATNVCDKELSIITPIGIDHQAFLGETIEEIAGTKIRSIQKQVLLAPQVYDEVIEVAREIVLEKGANIIVGEGTPRPRILMCIAKEKGWPDYLIENASVALEALDILELKYAIDDLKSLELFGRFYALTPNIRIDVGHNPLAASAIEKALDEKVVLIYNSLDDKDYEEVLRSLKA